MTELIALYINALKNIHWQDIDLIEITDTSSMQWLTEKGSLSRRLAENCHELSVSLVNNQMILENAMTMEERSLLTKEKCLLREVILKGDDSEWVVGRTLIPESSIQNKAFDLSRQGESPLGLTLFSLDDISRDQIQAGWAETPDGKLLARRSRLWVNGKPLLVAELFLPDSPVYSKENG
ncbi:chorismate lyase [Vibrio sp. JC009]|uniref:chorismate lyase n=1 Tax=Vibrio sp. JC009 TaxID=2912314 RepID=UPI0023B18145|nr:chorismate lyase [Vibrio sp. JC009]WED21744.1 chorismate lyase [Vibrio sp. JC009]